MLQGWMLRYRLLDASRQNSLWLGVAGVFGDPGSLFPARLGVEVFHRWQFCSGDVLLSSFRHSPWCWGRICRVSWLLLSFSQVSNICSFVNEANLVRFVEVDSGRLPRHSNRQWSCSRHQTLSPNTGAPCASRFFYLQWVHLDCCRNLTLDVLLLWWTWEKTSSAREEAILYSQCSSHTDSPATVWKLALLGWQRSGRAEQWRFCLSESLWNTQQF